MLVAIGGPVAQDRSRNARCLPYGDRPARNRQLTLLAELLGEGWRQELQTRLGAEPATLTRRQAAAEIVRLTGGRRPAHVAPSSWHRVAVDPDWVDRARRWSLRPPAPRFSYAHPVVERSTGLALPVQIRAIRLLGETLGIDVAAEARTRFAMELATVDKHTAAVWIAELTQQVLTLPQRTSAA